VKYLSLFTNGTLALITALRILEISGEVITTPYSFVATSNSILWNNLKPVFVDIEPIHLNLDPAGIEAVITPETTAILPVHVYGNPCRIKEITEIAGRHDLKVIYDAAHAFGVEINDNSILNFGDLSILSFHATKTFTTFEGGAIICHDKETKAKIDHLKNFGFAGETEVVSIGINSKMSEIQAAMGLAQLNYIDANIGKRRKIYKIYKEKLSNIAGITTLSLQENVSYNYGYFPILIDQQKYGRSRDDVYFKLKESDIYCRRYFYPLISNFPAYNKLYSAAANNLPVANKIAEQVLCLPIYPELNYSDILRIIDFLEFR